MRCILLLAIIGAAYAAVPASRMFGGYDTSIALNPYMANVKYAWLGTFVHHICGGSIINNAYILTAAQCVHNQDASDFTVVVGSGRIDGSGGIAHSLANLFTHPSYDRTTVVHDLALLRVSTIIDLTSALVSAIVIAGTTYIVPDNTEVSALGWGSQELFGSSADQLKKVDYYTIAHVTCVSLYANTNYPVVTTDMICFGDLEGPSKGICDGDAGGPVVHNGTVQMGISSWTANCDDFSNPDVATNVATHSAWISSNAV